MSKRIQYYQHISDDVVTSANQNYQLPPDFKWQHDSRSYQAKQSVMYAIAKEIGRTYWQTKLHLKIVGREKLAAYANQGYFLYGNHTQAFGDPMLPMLLSRQPVHTLASPANLAVPIVGPLLPLGRALITPQTPSQLRLFYEAIESVIRQKDVVAIYPEAHVWPYYTKIRPFSEASFHYPVAFQAPVFVFTTTYQRHHATVYIDGPLKKDTALPRKEQQRALMDLAFDTMQKRSRASTYQHISYRRQSV